MNVSQIIRLAAYQAKAVKQSLALGPSILVHELVALANYANDKIEEALRKRQDDYFVRIMNSATDTSAQKIMGISYTPSTSLVITASSRTITLPPDFVSLRSIRCVTSGYEETRFQRQDITSQHFQSSLKDTTTLSPGADLDYDIIGERTMYLAQPVSSALNLEIAYVAKTKILVYYTTGTVAVTDATDDVVGVGTVWSSGTPFDSSYLDLHFGTSASATLPLAEPDYDYDYVNRGRVLTITDDTNIVLAANKAGTLAAGTGYIAASVPVMPAEFHYGITDYITGRILLSSGSAKAQGFFATYESCKAGAALRRQTADVETVESWTPYAWQE